MDGGTNHSADLLGTMTAHRRGDDPSMSTTSPSIARPLLVVKEEQDGYLDPGTSARARRSSHDGHRSVTLTGRVSHVKAPDVFDAGYLGPSATAGGSW